MSLPPTHPALVHFPTALITLSVIAEFIGYFWKSEAAGPVAWWTLMGRGRRGRRHRACGHAVRRASVAPEAHRLLETHMKTGWIVANGRAPRELQRISRAHANSQRESQASTLS